MLIWILIGFVSGLIVGWNLIPQPAWVQAKYASVARQVTKWFLNLSVLLVLLPGCSFESIVSRDIGYAKERAMAEIAIASATAESLPSPDNKPKVGDKCPDCNDPPGACGVGKTGDGRVCNTCGLCNGDGRIDQRDITQDRPLIEPIPDPIPSGEKVQKEITLHLTPSTKNGWPSKWYAEQRQAFDNRGWLVRLIMEPEQATKVAYFDVRAPDGEVFQFYNSITPNDVRHLETR